MSPQNLPQKSIPKITLKITNGPSREDLIFRGLCDNQRKVFRIILEKLGSSWQLSTSLYVTIDGVESRRENPDHHIHDRHLWKIKGYVTQDHSEGYTLLFLFEMEYNSQTRTGKFIGDCVEELKKHFGQ